MAWMMHLRNEKGLLQNRSNPNNAPTQVARSPLAAFEIRLHYEENYRAPEYYFQPVEDGVGFVAAPAVEAADVVGDELVGEEDEGFGALESRVSIECLGSRLERGTLPFLMQWYLRGSEAGSS